MLKKIKTLFFILLISSCGKNDQESSSQNRQESIIDQINEELRAPLPKISELKWYETQWDEKWSDGLLKNIETTDITTITLLREDLEQVQCQGYSNATLQEKQNFWVVFFASMAAFESSFNPELRFYEESLEEFSEGLLQLSLSDRSSSPLCNHINEETLLEPTLNLKCGLGIMLRQLKGSPSRDLLPGTLFPKKAYYWSVLTRPSSKTKVIEFFKSHLIQLSFCK